MTALLTVTGARCCFGARGALDGIDVEIGAGQHVAVLGANGAGKTSLLRAIAGRIPLSAGSIFIDGHLAGTKAARGLIGVIPQRLALFLRLTARENLSAFGRLGGLGARDTARRATELLRWIDLEARADDPVLTLSGGMQRRLSIACGTIHAPRLLLADEPMVGIDAEQRGPVERLLAQLRNQGTTVIESTHELARVIGQFDQVLVLRAGRITTRLAPSELAGAVTSLRHHCRVTLSGPAAEITALPGLHPDGNVLSGELSDIAEQLPRLLATLHADGIEVRELSVRSPTVDDFVRTVDARVHE